VKDKNKPIVVVVTVERGGFGAETAAPAARLILSEWFDVDDDREFHAGTDQSN
jgi:penicillin-binding protein 2